MSFNLLNIINITKKIKRMNKKMFFGIITSVLLVCSAVFFLACTKDTGNKQELSTELTKEQKDVVKNALAVSDGKILPLGSQEHKLNQLSESQIAYAIGLLKQDLAQSWREDNSKHEIGWDYNDYYNLSDAQHDAIIKIATQLFKKPSNQITNSEYLDIIDNHYSEVINEVLNTTSSEKIKKLFEGKNKNSSQASSQRVVARSGCPAYYYGIRTTVSDSGNRSCRMSLGKRASILLFFPYKPFFYL